MLQLPVPVYVALTLTFVLLRALRREREPTWPAPLLALIALCALQSLVVAAAQHYGVAAAQAVQPLLAACLPPCAWLAFVSGTRRGIEPRRDSWHALGPTLVALVTLLQPAWLDPLIPALFAGYALAMRHSLRRHEDGLPIASLEHGDLPRQVWRLVAAALLLSALSDLLIVLDQVLGTGNRRMLIVSLFSSLTLLAVGLVATAPEARGRPDQADRTDRPGRPAHSPGHLAGALSNEGRSDAPPDPPGAASSAQDDPALAAADAALMQRLAALMRDAEPFRDPDLTLTRLARRLTVPAKRLSATINRQHGENVSRHVNRYRIEHACAALAGGGSVTSAMLDSGFATRSNFNREFTRITGTSPVGWRERVVPG